MSPSDLRKVKRVLSFADDLHAMMEERDITRELVESDQFVQRAVTTPLYNIGEYVSHLSKETREEHPDIPWSKVAGLRHRLVHDCESTKWDIVTQVLFDDLWEFADQLRKLVADAERDEVEPGEADRDEA
ncbi:MULTISPECIES: DUF86 domain-containing protein [unclassified Adlercreutzia]|uniref:HepT-like ribonuclease domain-containing protein n=1 Tax=unclassified Adlercreutzia TaxID=2636013 RepID=UPI0013EA5A9C|nr:MULTISPECIES: HepT-like ribonuclease domain-containing protein [unclassified Adlercreutzia]